MSSQSRTYGTLDGLRGVAAIAVVALHAPALFGGPVAPSAGLAVDLFFVMSGFIIAHAYEQKILDGRLSASRFMMLRLIRLYPLYIVGLFLGILEALAESYLGKAQAWTGPQLFRSATAGLLMLPSPPGIENGAAPAFRLNPPAWSLFFEMFVNILYGAVATRLSNRVVAITAVVAAAALIGTAVYAGDLNVGSYWNRLWGGFPRVLFSFSVGLLIFRFRARITVPRIWPPVILAIAALVFVFSPGSATGMYGLVCTIVVMPVLVVLGCAVEPSRRLAPTFAFLGVTSYAIYSLHYPIVMATHAVARKLLGADLDKVTPFIGVAFIGLLLLLCLIIDRIYDAPVRRRLLSALGPAKSRRVIAISTSTEA